MRVCMCVCVYEDRVGLTPTSARVYTCGGKIESGLAASAAAWMPARTRLSRGCASFVTVRDAHIYMASSWKRTMEIFRCEYAEIFLRKIQGDQGDWIRSSVS